MLIEAFEGRGREGKREVGVIFLGHCSIHKNRDKKQV